MWALIIDGVVREITEIDPVGRFHPSLEWLACVATVAPGDRYVGGGFVPAPDEDAAALGRAWRDAEVAASEWLVNRHRDELDMQASTTLSAEQFAELLEYRQILRDWPQSAGFPGMEYRPVAPPWLADLTP